MYNCIPIYTLQTMQELQHLDPTARRYLAAGALALAAFLFAIVASV